MPSELATLTLDLHAGDSLSLDGPASVQFLEKSGRLARVRVTAPYHVSIKRVAQHQKTLGGSVASVAELQPG